MQAKDVNRWNRIAKAMCYRLWPNLTRARKRKLWQQASEFICQHDEYDIRGWEEGEVLLCDEVWDHLGQYADDIRTRDKNGWGEFKDNPRYFFNQLRCVLRASIDLVKGGCGVLGFHMGDLRRLFNGKLPLWLKRQYNVDLATVADGEAIWM